MLRSAATLRDRWATSWAAVTARRKARAWRTQLRTPLACAVFGVLIFAAALAPPPAAGQTQEQRVKNLEKQVDDLKNDRDRILTPIAILIGVLAAGGILSVVFSIRDQRRVGQLHELAVTSETSSQRRADETYTLFLDASQRTLTLVNDTLELAREATQSAAQSMKQKSESSLDAIEHRAQRLLLDFLEEGFFESIVETRESRDQLEEIARDLEALEGYLLLQDIDLPPYSRFLKGIDHHLRDEADEALEALNRAAQDDSKRDLQRFSRYWVGYLHNTRGRYQLAAEQFHMAKQHLPADWLQTFELDRKIAEADFFRIASASEATRTRERLAAVREQLVRLEGVEDRLYRHEHDKSLETSHQVAATRAAVLTWIAYDPANPVGTLTLADIKAAQSARPDDGAGEIGGVVPIDAFEKSQAWSDLEDGPLRAWALEQARQLYKWQEAVDKDFSLSFGQAECNFALGEQRDIDVYDNVQRKAEDRLAWHREPRETAELDQTVLICRGRILELCREGENPAAIEDAKAELRSAHADAKRALGEVGDEITILSHLQKRNLTKVEFAQELNDFEHQELDPETFQKRKREASVSAS